MNQRWNPRRQRSAGPAARCLWHRKQVKTSRSAVVQRCHPIEHLRSPLPGICPGGLVAVACLSRPIFGGTVRVDACGVCVAELAAPFAGCDRASSVGRGLPAVTAPREAKPLLQLAHVADRTRPASICASVLPAQQRTERSLPLARTRDGRGRRYRLPRRLPRMDWRAMGGVGLKRACPTYVFRPVLRPFQRVRTV